MTDFSDLLVSTELRNYRISDDSGQVSFSFFAPLNSCTSPTSLRVRVTESSYFFVYNLPPNSTSGALVKLREANWCCSRLVTCIHQSQPSGTNQRMRTITSPGNQLWHLDCIRRQRLVASDTFINKIHVNLVASYRTKYRLEY